MSLEPWPPTDARRLDVTRARAITAVVCAAFDEATDRAILAVRDAVIGLGLPLPARPPHRPHLTLAAARIEPWQLADVAAVADEVAANWSPIRLVLNEVGRFGRAGALWVGPDGSTPHGGGATDGVAALRRLQRAVDSALVYPGWPPAFAERSAPHGWVPHCTLATRLHPARLRELQSAVQAVYRPIDAVVAGLAVIVVGGSGDVAVSAFTSATSGSAPPER